MTKPNHDQRTILERVQDWFRGKPAPLPPEYQPDGLPEQRAYRGALMAIAEASNAEELDHAEADFAERCAKLGPEYAQGHAEMKRRVAAAAVEKRQSLPAKTGTAIPAGTAAEAQAE